MSEVQKQTFRTVICRATVIQEGTPAVVGVRKKLNQFTELKKKSD